MDFDNRRILLIDDMPGIHSDFRKILEPAQTSALDAVEAALFGDTSPQSDAPQAFALESAYQGEEGFQKAMAASQAGQPFSLAFVDMRMPPGWDGVQTIQELWKFDPRLQVVICTAYSDTSWESVLGTLKLSDRLLILKKPFDAIEVQQLARMLTDKWRLERLAERERATLEEAVAERTDQLRAVNEALREDIARRERVEAEQRVAASVYHIMADSVAILNLDGTIRSINPAFTQLTGHPAEAAKGRSIGLLSAGEGRFSEADSTWSRTLESGQWTGELWSERADGSRFLADLRVVMQTDSIGQPAGFVCVFHDVTERRAREEQIRHMAFHDSLTGLPNQALLRDRLERALATAKRNEGSLGLMFVDLDRFKYVNDTFGHGVGDELLIEVARRLEGCVRESDTVARIGGDEFVILLGTSGDRAGYGVVADKVLDRMMSPFSIGGHTVEIGASIGIARFPDNGRTAEELVKCADSAMYDAKAAGKGVYRYCDESSAGKAPHAN